MVEGLEKGLAEGELKKATSVAITLKAKGMSIQDIAEITGLAGQEVKLL